MSAGGPRRYVKIITAGNTASLRAGGRAYWIEDSGGQPFTMQFDDGAEFQAKEGVSSRTDQDFSYVNFNNNIAGADITVIIWVGPQNVNFFPKQTTTLSKNAPTYDKGSGDQNIAGGGTLTFSGVDVGGNARKTIVVTNTNTIAGNIIYVQDGGGNNMMTVYPSQSKGLETGGVIKVKNPNGGGVVVQVGEVFYS